MIHLADWMTRIDLREEIQEVYLHTFLFKMAVNLVSIFLPLYILDLGYGAQTVFLFFMVYYGVYVIGSIPFGYISSHLGYKHTSLLSSPFILIFYLLLEQSPHGIFLYAVAAIGGTGFNLYWMGMNPEVAESSHSEKREEETGIFFSMPTLASLFAPTLGGLVLYAYSFEALFIATAMVIGLSFVPFLFSREHRDGMDVNALFFFDRSHVKDFLLFFTKGSKSMGRKVLWPLYLAIVIKSSATIGGAGSLVALGSAATSIGIGELTDNKNRDRVISAGILISFVTFLLMSQVASAESAFLLSFLSGIGSTAISLPIYSRVMDKAEEEDYISYFAFREIGLSLGRTSVLLALFAAFRFTQHGFLIGFALISGYILSLSVFGRDF